LALRAVTVESARKLLIRVATIFRWRAVSAEAIAEITATNPVVVTIGVGPTRVWTQPLIPADRRLEGLATLKALATISVDVTGGVWDTCLGGAALTRKLTADIAILTIAAIVAKQADL
jgi:hypothetical protein